jgi:hypothetical protein
VHLIGGDAGSVGVPHGVDHVVDQALYGRALELLLGERARGFTQHRVADGGDLSQGHEPIVYRFSARMIVRGDSFPKKTPGVAILPLTSQTLKPWSCRILPSSCRL